MTVRSRLLALASCAVLPVLAAGCGHKSASSASAPANNIFRYPIKTAPTTFDPAMVQDGDTIDLLQQMFEGLVQWSPDNKIVPCLAEKWDVSADGLTYTFHLRPGVKFQDGTSGHGLRRSVFACADAWSPKLGSSVALNYLGRHQRRKRAELRQGD